MTTREELRQAAMDYLANVFIFKGPVINPTAVQAAVTLVVTSDPKN